MSIKLHRKGNQRYETSDGVFVISKYMDSWIIEDREYDEITDCDSFAEARRVLTMFLEKAGA